MRVLIAPDSFKGSLSSIEVANAMANGVKAANLENETIIIPMADGGEGTVEALVSATNGKMIPKEVSGPLGESMVASFGILGDGVTGVVEVAAASGLALIPEKDRNPMITSSYGTGQLIQAALDEGCKRLIIGLGGSATNDGGMGIARALGVKFFDDDGLSLIGRGRDLLRVSRIDVKNLDPRLKEIEIIIACDVTNPFCGPKGAAAIFAPQKGANPEMVKQLDQGLNRFAAVMKKELGKDVREIPGAGAAGGIGGGLMALLNPSFRPGIELVMELTNLPQLIEEWDLVLTGEGRTDEQTLFGKVPQGLGLVAKDKGKPVLVISGSIDYRSYGLLEHGITAIFSVVPGPTSLENAMAEAETNISFTTEMVMRTFRQGQ